MSTKDYTSDKLNVTVVIGMFSEITEEIVNILKKEKSNCDFLFVAIKSCNIKTIVEKINVLESIKYVGQAIIAEENSQLTYDKVKFVFPKSDIKVVDLTRNFQSEHTIRPWGHYSVLKNYGQYAVKVKELVVKPGKYLSLQKHKHRFEEWFVVSGSGKLFASENLEGSFPVADIDINKSDTITIFKNEWHQLVNNSNEDLIIVELQHGDFCDETDITRIEKSFWVNNDN